MSSIRDLCFCHVEAASACFAAMRCDCVAQHVHEVLGMLVAGGLLESVRKDVQPQVHRCIDLSRFLGHACEGSAGLEILMSISRRQNDGASNSAAIGQ